jgi:hypothetical protein
MNPELAGAAGLAAGAIPAAAVSYYLTQKIKEDAARERKLVSSAKLYRDLKRSRGLDVGHAVVPGESSNAAYSPTGTVGTFADISTTDLADKKRMLAATRPGGLVSYTSKGMVSPGITAHELGHAIVNEQGSTAEKIINSPVLSGLANAAGVSGGLYHGFMNANKGNYGRAALLGLGLPLAGMIPTIYGEHLANRYADELLEPYQDRGEIKAHRHGILAYAAKPISTAIAGITAGLLANPGTAENLPHMLRGR